MNFFFKFILWSFSHHRIQIWDWNFDSPNSRWWIQNVAREMKKFYFDYSKIKILNPNLDSVVRKFQKNCKNLVKKLRKPHVKGNPFLLQYLFVKTQFLFTVTREIKKFYFHFSKIKILDLNLDSSVQKSEKKFPKFGKKTFKNLTFRNIRFR